MEPTDLTIEILKDIRQEIRDTRTELKAEIHGLSDRVDLTNVRIDETNQRLDETNQRLDETNQRLVASEVRTSTAIADLAGKVREMTQVLRSAHDLRPRVERCEEAIRELQRA